MDGGYLVCATPPSVYWHYYINKNTGGGHKFFEFACWYMQQISGERLQDHWSSGSDLIGKFLVPVKFGKN